jgi:hypothetical protein
MWPLARIGLLLLLVFSTTALAQKESPGPKESFVAVRLSAKETREIIAGVNKSAYDIPESWPKELRVPRVNLGIGPGIVVQGTNLLCGGTGNCQIWVFRKSNAIWLSLFANDEAVLAEGFKLGPSVTHHVRDLIIETNLDAEDTKRITYKFDGRLYRNR